MTAVLDQDDEVSPPCPEVLPAAGAKGQQPVAVSPEEQERRWKEALLLQRFQARAGPLREALERGAPFSETRGTRAVARTLKNS